MTPRLLLLTVSGIVPVMLAPGWQSLAITAGVIVVLAVIDRFARPRRRSCACGGPRVRWSASATTPGRRSHSSTTPIGRSGPRVRDAWPPSAGAHETRTRLTLPPHGTREITTVLSPRRRGALATDRVTLRTTSVLGLIARQRSVDVPATVRVLPPFVSRRSCPRSGRSRASSTAARR